MNFLSTGFKGKNNWWMYLIMIAVVFTGMFIGQIPITVVALAEVNGDLQRFTESVEKNFTDLGIDSNLYVLLMLLGFITAFLLFIIVLKGMHKKKLTWVITSREKIDWKRIGFGILVWGIISIGSMSIDLILSPENYEWNFKLEKFLVLCTVALLCIPIQTTLEEVLFRGYYMQALAISTTKKQFGFILVYILLCISLHMYYTNNLQLDVFTHFLMIFGYGILLLILSYSKILHHLTHLNFANPMYLLLKRNIVPLVLTSLLFGLMHIGNPEIDKLGYTLLVFYIGSGFLFGVVTLLDDGAELAIGMHAINNMIAALFITTNWTVFQTDALYMDISEPSLSFEMFLPMMILYPLTVLILSKKYHWSSWKEKLFGEVKVPNKNDVIHELGT